MVKHASGVSTPNGDTRIVTSCVPSAHTHCRRDETRDTARQVASSTRGVIQRPGRARSPHEGQVEGNSPAEALTRQACERDGRRCIKDRSAESKTATSRPTRTTRRTQECEQAEEDARGKLNQLVTSTMRESEMNRQQSHARKSTPAKVSTCGSY